MNGPDDEVSLLDQSDVFLCQSLEQRIESQSTAQLARTASSRHAVGSRIRQAPVTIISHADA
jgi:hypothetical protein